MEQQSSLDHLVTFFHTLTPESVARFPEFYRVDAYFKDPFNEVYGVKAIAEIFTHMFRQVDAPRFVVIECMAGTDSAMLVWDFHFRVRLWRRSEAHVIRGVSHLKFATDGKVEYHRDYWDAAEELYMKLPLAGRMMRYLKNAFACKPRIE